MKKTSKMTVTFACGCEQSVEYSYERVENKDDRLNNRKIAKEQAKEQASTTKCPRCLKREADQTEASKAASKLKLPALTGSEKQIKWASDIREKALVAGYLVLNRYKKEIAEGVNCRIAPYALEEITNNTVEEIMKKAVNHTSAAWWIENKNHFHNVVTFEFWYWAK